MDELVSIIIPAYNAEQWIDETIRSAIGQTWPHKEIIIVDDGSTDNTLLLAKRYQSRLVKVVTQPNSGVSAARNKGLALAQGNYIQWLDADDLLAPEKVSCQLQLAEHGLESRTLLTSSFGTFYICPNRVYISPSALWQDLSPVDWLTNKFYYSLWMNPATWLVSRKLTALAGPWNEGLVRDNDGEYICRVVAASERVEFVLKAMSYYRIGFIGSVSNNPSQKARESLGLSLRLCTSYLLALENSERTRTACVKYLQSFMPFFYPESVSLLLELSTFASELGGKLIAPPISWKYMFLDKLCGRSAAKQFMARCVGAKFKAVIAWERFLCKLMHETH